MDPQGPPVGRVVGTDDATPLEFWVAVSQDEFLQLDDEPLFVNLEFVDGTRGAPVNISGVSGVATRTTYATFLLYSLFTSGVLDDSLNTSESGGTPRPVSSSDPPL